MSFVLLSQNMRGEQQKIKISKPALVLMKQDFKYCDSLKKAYVEQVKEFQKLTQRNNLLFSILSKENEKAVLLQNQIDVQQKEIAKIKTKSNKCWLYGVGGAALGIVIGVIISK